MLPFWRHYASIALGNKKKERTMAIAKSERVCARVPANVYNVLSQAAELSGATINQFLVQSALEKAQSVIEQELVIAMTTASSAAFFNAIVKPPAPSKKLRQAVKSYKKLAHHAKN